MVVEIVLSTDLDALVVGVEEEVDDARDRIRAVNRRGTARQDIDALDQLRRNLVDAHRFRIAARPGDATRAARVHAAAVYEYQVTL